MADMGDAHQQNSPAGFLGGNELKDRRADIFKESAGCLPHVEQAAYALRLGGEVFVAGETEKSRLEPNDVVMIPPGRIAVLLTEEKVKIPDYLLGFISLKSSVKEPGLINVSGFHVDPGFYGRLIFTVYNAGTETAVFQRGDAMFLLWLARVGKTDPYGGNTSNKHKNLRAIPSRVIGGLTATGASPMELDERIKRLEHTVTWLRAIGIAVLIGLLLFLIRTWVNDADRATSANRPAVVTPAIAARDPGTKDHAGRMLNESAAAGDLTTHVYP